MLAEACVTAFLKSPSSVDERCCRPVFGDGEEAFSMAFKADERVYITSLWRDLDRFFLGSKIEEKVSLSEFGGIAVVIEMGLWTEKKDARCMSAVPKQS